MHPGPLRLVIGIAEMDEPLCGITIADEFCDWLTRELEKYARRRTRARLATVWTLLVLRSAFPPEILLMIAKNVFSTQGLAIWDSV